MGTYVGNTLVAGATFNPTLLDFKWTDHILNDVSWLRADTFSWQPGSVYEAVYNHLADEYANAVFNLPVTAATQNAYLGNNKGSWRVVWDGTKFVAISAYGYVSTSEDGMTWAAATQNANLGNNDWCTIEYDGTKFVALGYNGHISTSTNGADWTVATQNANLGDNKWSKILWNGTKFVALGYDGYISTSEDGTIWTEATQNANLSQGYGWCGLAYDGTKFVALGVTTYTSTSTDGINWSVPVVNANLGFNNLWYGGLTYTGNGFIAVAWNGAVSRSLDGVTWEPAVVDANLGNKNWSTIVYNGDKLLFVGNAAWLSETEFSTETVAGTTIKYCAAADGHKICPASEESNVSTIYNATGVAWYYILDTSNTRFKLPRTKFGFTGMRDIVGNYVAPGLPNLEGDFHAGTIGDDYADNVLFKKTTSSNWTTGQGYYGFINSNMHMNASVYNSIYGNSTTVQPPATQMYLYFYVGNFTKSAIQQTAGLNAELFNDKVDKGHQVIAFQAPTAANNYTWYRKYADGWVEQGGQFSNSARSTTINLPITMADTNYYASVMLLHCSSDWSATVNAGVQNNSRTTSSFIAQVWYNSSNTTGLNCWEVKGMAA